MFASIKINLVILLLGIILFVPFLGNVHLFDWDEINFAEAAREMIVSGNYSQVQINFEPFWEKPPLFIWLQVLSMKIFGVNEFAARFPNALSGIVTLLIIFQIGKKHYGERFGIWWVAVFIGSFLPHFYFKTGIIDPVFNLFIFSGIYFLFVHISNKEINKIILLGIFIGLAILTKGPVALLIFSLCLFVFWVVNRFRKIMSSKSLLFLGLSVFVISFLWFGIEYVKNGSWFIREFIVYQFRLLSTEDAGHGGPVYYHVLVLLFGCFPASLIFIPMLIKKNNGDDFHLLMKILFWVVLVVFSIVKTKIVHYSSLAYFPITFFSACYLYKINLSELSWKKWLNMMIVILGGLMGLAIALLPYFAQHKEFLTPYIKDDFAIACLNTKVNWNGYESGIGLFFLLMVLISFVLLSKNKIKTGVMVLFFSSIVTLQLSLFFIVPKIEKYSQATAVDFYESLKNEDCYIKVLGFKSYAHLFYGKIKPENKTSDESFLLNGKITQPAYFVSKITLKEDYANLPQLKILKEENGFVFYKREANHE